MRTGISISLSLSDRKRLDGIRGCCATIKVRTRDNQDEKVLPGLG